MEREMTFEEMAMMTKAIVTGTAVQPGFPIQEARLRKEIAEIAESGLVVDVAE